MLLVFPSAVVVRSGDDTDHRSLHLESHDKRVSNHFLKRESGITQWRPRARIGNVKRPKVPDMAKLIVRLLPKKSPRLRDRQVCPTTLRDAGTCPLDLKLDLRENSCVNQR